mmetsp:Transcript_10843/g.26046  ORF Transcript_10843/g.26046 Transcript_10843/m.26046 type:complete len:313 (+) Transcript_10843:103-1041(+)
MLCARLWIRVLLLTILLIVNLKVRTVASFANYISSQSPRRWQRAIAHNRPAVCQMVRNIDMVEALIFYGTASIFDPTAESNTDTSKSIRVTGAFLPGVDDLIEECKRDDTAVVAILDDDARVLQSESDGESIVFKTETSPAPNPKDLWEAIHSITIQPKGFGGSSGFGRKAADPERSPIPAHCVVLCDTVDRCRAARYAGMRVLCLTDNELADGVINFVSDGDKIADLENHWESINMDDIATPGSFWLNPPLPKDDEGNGVNVLSIIESYRSAGRENKEQSPSTTKNNEIFGLDVDDEDSYLHAILKDIERA